MKTINIGDRKLYDIEEEYNNYLIVVNPKRCISLDQMRLTHVLLKQYGDELGYTLDEIKNVKNKKKSD